jgi:regulator of protease activity HflC (stomatin/prohibitin superfamily)
MGDFVTAILGLIETAWDHITPFFVIKEYEGGIRLRFGRYKGTLSAGPHWKLPLIDSIDTCSIAAETISTKSQSLMTKDNISIFVSGAVKCYVQDPEKYLIKVKDVDNAISDIAQGVIKRVITSKTFDECREQDIDKDITHKLKNQAEKWGVKVESVIITTIDKGRTIRLIQS